MNRYQRWWVKSGGRHGYMAATVREAAHLCAERTGVTQIIHYHANTERCARSDHEVIAP